MKLYRGTKRNHPTARLRRIGKRLQALRAKYTSKMAAALAVFAMLYLSVR